MLKQLTVNSTQKTALIDITHDLQAMIQTIENGMVFFSVPHTSAALIICEDDPNLHEDLLRVAEAMFAPYRPFKHVRNNNPNAEAHLLSSFAGTQLAFAIVEGSLNLGAYQRIYLLELDGPRTRQVQSVVIDT